MNSELKKLKGVSIKTAAGDFTLKECIRQQCSQFDQIYFKATQQNAICKLYELDKPVSISRYNNETASYRSHLLPMLYEHVFFEQLKIKKKSLGLVAFSKLARERPLSQCMSFLSDQQVLLLCYTLLETLLKLKNQNLVFGNIRPENIYKVNGKFVLINAEYMTAKGENSPSTNFLLETVEKQWHYWPPEIIDTYTDTYLDFTTDAYAVGCILYTIKAEKYPFQSKLAALSKSYAKLENQGIVGQVIETCLQDVEGRRKIPLKQFMDAIADKIPSQRISPQFQLENMVPEKCIRKGSNNGFLDNISNAFTKMMNDTEGWFLNYVEDNEKEPLEKYLDSILNKIYKSEEKADKLGVIIQKFMVNNESKVFSIQKSLLLVGHILRRGPGFTFASFLPNITLACSQFKNSPQIESFAILLSHKVALNEKLKGSLSGNFYLENVSNFKQIAISDLQEMSVYLQKLIIYVKDKTGEKNSDLNTALLNFACDEIFNSISMLILSIISIRKDNELQLRKDNLKELISLEKVLNSSLKKISDLSSHIGAHAIYSLEGEYISYQQQIILSTPPYYSSLEHFYQYSRNYKGLLIPENYAQIYGNREEKKSVRAATVEQKLVPAAKDYFETEEIESDQDKEFQHSPKRNQKPEVAVNLFDQFSQFAINPIKSELKHTKSAKSEESERKGIKNIRKIENKRAEKSEKDDEQLSKNSKCSKSGSESKAKQESLISFEQFGNMHLQKKQPSQQTSDFDFFNELKKQSKPPLPVKKASNTKKGHYEKKSSFPNSSFNHFDQFNLILSTEKKEEKKKNGFIEFDDIEKHIQKPPNFDDFNPFVKELLMSPPKVDPLTDRIVSGLKHRELKELLIKHPEYIIQFSDLTLSQVIGSGSAGEVYLGMHRKQAVAIKKVKAKENPNALKQFQRQLVTYIKIKKNPHLVALVGLSQSNGDYYLITQFCESGSLFDLLHKKRDEIELTWKQRLSFAKEIAQGMKFLHSMKPLIIHRDLKSLNVFVAKQSNKWKMKVADFGLSRSPESEMMTTQLGTIHWMAPELLEGKQYSLKVDVYSYGILLWEILSRTTPYKNLQNPMAILKYVVMDKKRPALELIPKDCPTQLVSIMEKCWLSEPHDRPTFSQILSQLAEINL